MNDYTHEVEKQEHIRQQLALYQGPKIEGGGFTKILCPNHPEKTPSASVRHSNGWIKCFGCEYKASFDDWAPLAGMEPFVKGPPKEKFAQSLLMSFADDDDQEPEAKTPKKKRVRKKLDEDQGYGEWKLDYHPLPTGKKWRTIPTDLLIELGGRKCYKWSKDYKKWGSTPYVHLPVMVHGEQKGFFLARLKKDEKYASYLLAPSIGPAWSKTWGLWPFDYATKLMRDIGSRTLVLVEGQRDALRLLLNDIPAVCIFGTQSWSRNKAKQMELAGVKRVVQMMDGDDAGIKATKGTLSDLKELFEVKTVCLWSVKGSPYIPYADLPTDEERRDAIKRDGVTLFDPGNCPQWIIDRVRKKFV